MVELVQGSTATLNMEVIFGTTAPVGLSDARHVVLQIKRTGSEGPLFNFSALSWTDSEPPRALFEIDANGLAPGAYRGQIVATLPGDTRITTYSIFALEVREPM